MTDGAGPAPPGRSCAALPGGDPGSGPARGALRDRHLVHLGGPVVDPEAADVAVDAPEHELLGRPPATRELDRAVDYAAYGLGHENLGARGLLARAAALREHPRGVPEHGPRGMQVDLVLRDEGLGHAEL